jgi:hypothetical protein
LDRRRIGNSLGLRGEDEEVSLSHSIWTISCLDAHPNRYCRMLLSLPNSMAEDDVSDDAGPRTPPLTLRLAWTNAAWQVPDAVLLMEPSRSPVMELLFVSLKSSHSF